jgi:hypothetical protein
VKVDEWMMPVANSPMAIMLTINTGNWALRLTRKATGKEMSRIEIPVPL